jgi:hypothetical protein
MAFDADFLTGHPNQEIAAGNTNGDPTVHKPHNECRKPNVATAVSILSLCMQAAQAAVQLPP